MLKMDKPDVNVYQPFARIAPLNLKQPSWIASASWSAPALWRLGSRGWPKAPEDWRTPKPCGGTNGSWKRSSSFETVSLHARPALRFMGEELTAVVVSRCDQVITAFE